MSTTSDALAEKIIIHSILFPCCFPQLPAVNPVTINKLIEEKKHNPTNDIRYFKCSMKRHNMENFCPHKDRKHYAKVHPFKIEYVHQLLP